MPATRHHDRGSHAVVMDCCLLYSSRVADPAGLAVVMKARSRSDNTDSMFRIACSDSGTWNRSSGHSTTDLSPAIVAFQIAGLVGCCRSLRTLRKRWSRSFEELACDASIQCTVSIAMSARNVADVFI